MTNAPTIAFVTIGQSPRDDMVPEMLPHLDGCPILEWGALDGLTDDEMRDLEPLDGEAMVVSRISDGRQVRMDKRLVDPRVEVGIRECQGNGADITVMTCTSTFPDFESTGPVLIAGRLIRGTVLSVAGKSHLGIVCPDEDQVHQILAEWGPQVRQVSVLAASPYQPGAEEIVARQARQLRTRGADYVFLNCMGYTRAMQAAARRQVGSRVLLSRTLVSRVVGDLVS